MTPRQLTPSDMAPPETTTQKGQPMTDTPTSVTITATDPTTHRAITRTFHDTHLSIDGNRVPRTARDQANDYAQARRAAGCEIKESQWVAPLLEAEGL